MRTTKSALRAQVEFLKAQGYDISIGWAYGRPRCTTKDGSKELSPRLTSGEMAIWLTGYSTGLAAQWDKMKSDDYCDLHQGPYTECSCRG